MKKLFNLVGGNVFKLITEMSNSTVVTPEIFANTLRNAMIAILDIDPSDIVIREAEEENLDDYGGKDGDHFWYSCTIAFRYETFKGKLPYVTTFDFFYNKDSPNERAEIITVDHLKKSNPKFFFSVSIYAPKHFSTKDLDIRTMVIGGLGFSQTFEPIDCGFDEEKNTIKEVVDLLKSCLDNGGGDGGEEDEDRKSTRLNSSH